MVKFSSTTSLSGICSASVFLLVIIATQSQAKQVEFATAKGKPVNIEASQDSAEINRVKEACTELSNGWTKHGLVPRNSALGAFKACPAQLRMAQRTRLEEFASGKEGQQQERGLLLLKIAYGDKAAFEEFVAGIDTTVDLNNRSSALTLKELREVCEVARHSWLNSDAFAQKINAMFEHENRFSVERLILLLCRNNLHQFAPQAIAYFKKGLPEDRNERTINKIKMLTGSRVAFDFVKSVQKDYRIDHIKSFTRSTDPEIRKEAREYSKLPPWPDELHVQRQELQAKPHRKINQDMKLDSELKKILVDAGWPESTQLDDLQVYSRTTAVAVAYGEPIAMTLMASKIGWVANDASGRIAQDDFELIFMKEPKPDVKGRYIESYVVNDKLYQFESGFSGPFLHAIDRQNLINTLLEKNGISQRIAILGNPKYSNDAELAMWLCAQPERLAELKKSLTLKYVEGK